MIFSQILPGFLFTPRSDDYSAPIASPVFDLDSTFSITDSKYFINNSRIVRILGGQLFISNDLGSSWVKASDVSDAADFIDNFDYQKLAVLNKAYDKVYILSVQSDTFTQFQLPENLSPSYNLFDFSISLKHQDWLIVNALDPDPSNLPWTVAWTKDSSETWHYYDFDSFETCEFIEGGQFVDDLVYCEVQNKQKETHHGPVYNTYYTTNLNEPLQLVKYDPSYPHITRHGNILTALDYCSQNLTISYDGIHFTMVELPPNLSSSFTNSSLKVEHSEYFESRGSLLVFQPYNSAEEDEHDRNGAFGNIFTLETPYKLKLLLENVATGYETNFKAVLAEESVFIANVVANPEGVKFMGETPILKTVITFDGGNHWESLRGPNDKSIHLTLDDIYFYNHFKKSVYGIFSALGNEGDYLVPSANSYFTLDSGRTWSEMDDDFTKYEFGNNNNIILDTPSSEDVVDHVKYSLDKGSTWHEYFLGFKATIYAIAAKGDNFLIICSPLDNPKHGESQYGLTLTFKRENHDTTLGFFDRYTSKLKIASLILLACLYFSVC